MAVFSVDVHHYLHWFDQAELQRLDKIDSKLAAILTGVNMVQQVTTDLETTAGRIEALVGNIATELNELKTALDNAIAAGGGDTAALQVVRDRLEAAANALAAAGTAVDITPDTPVEGAPPAPGPGPT